MLLLFGGLVVCFGWFFVCGVVLLLFFLLEFQEFWSRGCSIQRVIPVAISSLASAHKASARSWQYAYQGSSGRLMVEIEVPLKKCSGSGIYASRKKWLQQGIKDRVRNSHYKPLKPSFSLIVDWFNSFSRHSYGIMLYFVFQLQPCLSLWTITDYTYVTSC